MGDGPTHGADVIAQAGRRTAEVKNSVEVAVGGGIFVKLGGGTVEAAIVGGITQPGLVGGGSMICRCSPEACRGELVLPVAPTVLIEVIREPVQRPARDVGRIAGQLLTAVLGAGSGCAGSGRGRADAGERAADAFAWDGRVVPGLFQHVLPVPVQGVPFGAGQVPGRGCFQEGLRQRRSHAQAAGIHRRVDQRRRGERGVTIPGQQLRRPGQELGHLPVLRPRGGLGQPRVPRLAEPLHLRRGEHGRHGDVVAVQQLPRLGMRIGGVAWRAGGQAIPELRP